MKPDDCIDVKLLPTKGLYFLYYAGLSSFIPYKSLLQKQLGMSTGQNGLIQATMQLVSLFSPPVAGYITDKTKAYKVILAVCMFCSVVFTVPFYIVPPVEFETVEATGVCCLGGNYTMSCQELPNGTDVGNCEVAWDNGTLVPIANFSVKFSHCSGMESNSTCVMSSGFSASECEGGRVVMNCQIPDTRDVYSSTFAWLMFLTAAMSFFLAPATPLIDASAMDTLGVERVADFGNQRLWGAVGFGIVSLVVSYITDVVSPEEVYGAGNKNYIPSFVSAALFWFLAMFLILAFINITSPKATSILRGVGRLLTQLQVLAFLVVVFVSGFGTGIQYSYLFWFLQELGGSQTIMGLSVLVTCCSEIPMFYVSGWICNKLGYVGVLSVGLFAASVRFFTYSFIVQAWQVLLVEWLHGISFALPVVAMCAYSAVLAPKDTIATLMSLSQTVYWGLGNMAGALIGGVLYQVYGGRIMFQICGVICVIIGVLYLIVFHPRGFVLRYVLPQPAKTAEVTDDKITRPEEEPLHTEEIV